ncbi:MAG: hypothetical protein EBX50_06225 [Chitinophagia bacterium]|nr:hypothetical protein [Chitinophagia bacterium]
MLFLAVSLGFLAENIREHYVEKERAKELIVQLKSDIRSNLFLIDSIVQRDKNLVFELDSAMVYLGMNNIIDLDSLYSNLPPNIFRFIGKNDTYNQMKSSGSLRYIKDSVLLNKILNYANACTSAETRSTVAEGEYIASEFTNTMNAWMPKTEAIRRFLKDRSGIGSVVSKESVSLSLITPKSVEFVSQLSRMNDKRIVKDIDAEKLKDAILPVLTRRISLLVNTTRFLGRAKESGEDLLNYIEKNVE